MNMPSALATATGNAYQSGAGINDVVPVMLTADLSRSVSKLYECSHHVAWSH